MNILFIAVIYALDILYQNAVKENNSNNTMNEVTQQEAYDRYTHATTDGTRIAVHDTRILHQHFVNAIEQYTPPSTAPVVTKQEFLENLLTRTFHLYWAANLNPPAYGVGNPALLTMRRNEDSGDYDLSYVSLTAPTQTYTFDPSYYILHANSLMLKDGNTQLIIKRTRNTTVNGNAIWNHQFVIDGNLINNYYLVDFQL